MATGHWFTNRGKYLALQGKLADGTTTLGIGLLVGSQPAALDTEAEVQDINTVAELLTSGTGAATEAAFTNYVRKTLASVTNTEDDTNNRTAIDAADVTWTSAGGASNETVYGAFIYDKTTDTNDTTRLVVSVDWFASSITTNGGDLTYAIADLYRAS